MPRKTRRPPEFRIPVGVARPALGPRYAAVAMLSAVFGGGATYLVVNQTIVHSQKQTIARLTRQLQTAEVTSAPPDANPPPDLTAGQTPAKAARQLAYWYQDHGRWAEAIAFYQQAIAAGENNSDVLTDLGVTYYQSGQPQRALEQFQAAQVKDPQHENSLFNEGVAYAALRDPKHAVRAWRDYLTRFPQGQHVDAAKEHIAKIPAHDLGQTASPVP